jgi:protein-disulfide isomerase
MQDPTGHKYLAFHRELLGSGGPASKEKAFAAANDQGLDMTRLEKDVASDEVATTLDEDMKLAGELGIHGTPGYVIGNDVVVGSRRCKPKSIQRTDTRGTDNSALDSILAQAVMAGM